MIALGEMSLTGTSDGIEEESEYPVLIQEDLFTSLGGYENKDVTEQERNYQNILPKRSEIINILNEDDITSPNTNKQEKFKILQGVNKQDILVFLSLPENKQATVKQSQRHTALVQSLSQLGIKGVSDSTRYYGRGIASPGSANIVDEVYHMINKKTKQYRKRILEMIIKNAEKFNTYQGYKNYIKPGRIERTARSSLEEITKILDHIENNKGTVRGFVYGAKELVSPHGNEGYHKRFIQTYVAALHYMLGKTQNIKEEEKRVLASIFST